MKKNLYSAVLFCLISATAFAQPSNKTNYQAIVRDAGGNILPNKPVAFRLTIHNGSGGPMLYQERQTDTTNQFGLSNLKIGTGTPLLGNYDTITWSMVDPYLEVDLDPNGGTTYTTMGESQLLSVPSANYSDVSKSTLSLSGTNNYVPKFTSVNTVGNSQIIDDGTSVRVGATPVLGKLAVQESGTMRAFYSGHTGTIGGAGRFDITNAANSSDVLYLTTVGKGTVASMLSVDSTSSANALHVHKLGTGNTIDAYNYGKAGVTGYFKSQNAANNSTCLYAETDGGGAAVYGVTTGTGSAGRFLAFNGTTTADALFASNAGTGNAGYFYGNVVMSNGKMGLGTTTPHTLLELSSASPDQRITWTNSANFGRILYYESNTICGTVQQNGSTYGGGRASALEIQNLTATGAVSLWTNGINRIHITGGGSVGVGTTAPDQTFSVNGGASKTGGGSWATFSDSRLKKDVLPFHDGLDVVNRINPVRFKYNGLGGYPDNGKEYIGVIAQDIQKAAPYTVETKSKKLHDSDVTETDLLMYDSSALTYLLVNSVKELSAKVNELKAKVEKLEKENTTAREASAHR